MRAGTYISKGTYGCAFKQPLKCKGEPTRRPDNLISKLMSPEDAKLEIIQGRHYKRIDPEAKYFITDAGSCEFDETSLEPQNKMDMCANYNEKTKRYIQRPITNRTLVFYEDGGQDLSDLRLFSSYYVTFFEGLNNLFEGLAIAHENKIYHLDIKPSNIVLLNKGVISPRFIDFGISVSKKELFQQIKTTSLDQLYLFWPMEAPFIKAKGEFTRGHFNLWYKQFNYDPEIKSNSVLRMTYWDKYMDHLFKFEDIVEEYKKVSFDDKYAGLERIDVYMFGLTLSLIITKLTNHFMQFDYEKQEITGSTYYGQTKYSIYELPEEDHRKWHVEVLETVTRPLTELFASMVDIQPEGRPSIRSAHEKYREILPNIKRLFTEDNLDKYLLKVKGGKRKNTTRRRRNQRKTRKNEE